MSLLDRIAADLRVALKDRDQVRADALRSAMTAIKYKKSELASAREMTVDDEIAAIRKQVKQREDSIAAYTQANRPEAAAKETRERDILAAYLPAQKSEDEIRQLIQAAVDAMDPAARNQGAVMKAVMAQLKGLADGNLVKRIVGEILGGTR